MQDEINAKVIALVIRTGSKTAHLSSEELKKAMRKYQQHRQQVKTKKVSERREERAEKQKVWEEKQREKKIPRGKQTIGDLMAKNQELRTVTITDQNIKSFERVANKYHVDFALKKDKSLDPPKYVCFFKARDMEVINAAFTEYTNAEIKKTQKPSVQKKLAKSQEKARAKEERTARKKQQRNRQRTAKRTRGRER